MAGTLAIVGRPNVGKSTLFNRLVGRRLALVDNAPGVTRDRREGEARLGDLRFRVIDTAGFEQGDPASLAGRMRAQTEAAIFQSDAILFLVDAASGITPEDSLFASLVRRAGKPIILVANKTESRSSASGVYDSFALGFGDPVQISAEHGDGLSDLYDAVRQALPEAAASEASLEPQQNGESAAEDADGTEFDPAKPLRIAVVGRPNVGKSTLINRLLGEDRLLTGPEAGMTRDSISVDFEWRAREGSPARKMKLFDTAGMRKKARVENKLEKLAVGDALRAIKFAEIVVLTLDATAPFEKQDLTIADLTSREGRGLVIALDKWDLVANPGARLAELRETSDRLLPQVRGTPVVPVSGLTGSGCDKLMAATLRVEQLWNKRIGTGRLNRWLEGAIERSPPPAVAGRRIRIRYMTQTKARPPHFVLFGNQLDDLPTSYERYLVNGLRDAFDLTGVPIRVTRRQKDNPYAGKRP